MEFTVEEDEQGVLLRPAAHFPETSLEEVAGCLKATCGPITVSKESTAIVPEVKRRRESGRYKRSGAAADR